jgi:hypothetical protein
MLARRAKFVVLKPGFLRYGKIVIIFIVIQDFFPAAFNPYGLSIK